MNVASLLLPPEMNKGNILPRKMLIDIKMSHFLHLPLEMNIGNDWPRKMLTYICRIFAFILSEMNKYNIRSRKMLR